MCWLILRLANSLPEKQENTAESYLNQSQRLTTPNCLMHLKVTPKCLNFPSQIILFSSPQNKKEKKYKHIFAVFPISLDPFFSPECGSSDVLLSSSKFFYESKENSWTSPCFLGKAACAPWSHQVCANSSGQFWGFGHDVKNFLSSAQVTKKVCWENAFPDTQLLVQCTLTLLKSHPHLVLSFQECFSRPLYWRVLVVASFLFLKETSLGVF